MYVFKFFLKAGSDDALTTVEVQCESDKCEKQQTLEMWANAQRDGRPAEHRWRPLFNVVKFG